MFFYLFLIAAAVATAELPESDLSSLEIAGLQEVVAALSQETTKIAAPAAELENSNIAVQTQPITITNGIQPAMLEYKHWTGKYSPETFSITINGITVDMGKSCEIPAHATTVEIGYNYSFMNGMKTGGRKISYKLNENITSVNISFDWKNDWRIIIDNGKADKEIV